VFGRRGDDGRATGLVVLVLAGGAVALLVLLLVGGMLFRGSGGDHEETGPTASTAVPTVPPEPRAAENRPRAVVPRPASGRFVGVAAVDPDSFPDQPPAVDRLAPESVLQIRAGGFTPFSRGTAEQCAPTLTAGCGNRIPVLFDDQGVARFQYAVSNRFLAPAVPGRCRADGPRCTLVVRDHADGGRGEVQTVFVDAAPPAGRITVTPTTGLDADGEVVTVAVEGFPPRTAARAVLCAAPADSGSRCGAPGAAADLTIGADGSGRTRLRIAPGPVGRARVTCARGDECAVSVVARGSAARAPVVRVSFAAPAGAAYDPTRLLIGLGVALLLAAAAGWLILRSDWAAVGEAAAPEIDDAEYADLDAIIAALPPEEEDDPVLSGR
jgi:hypothetical protein